ncbi:MAG TPA: YkvA family protein [Candidatus Wallbacteria bacterium]|nr:MAG: hypothetical protein BWY32_01516 [bacterium ADurb.Bin243]HOD38931.1 YkvA family protein [Candidatus Wallbacteria bacterium]HPG59560.1 YkvA family protein [Candidatus Wallbacteria bacterium]
MTDKFCSNCKSAAASAESIYCHKCGARLAEYAADAAAPPQEDLSAAPAAPNVPQGGADDPGCPSLAGEQAGKEPVLPRSAGFFVEFQAGYYRLSYTASVLIMIGAVIYIISPLDIISNAPLISWVDDLLIFSCALVNLLHCGVNISNHSENVTFKRVKLIMVPLSAAIIFFMWFCVNIVLILFQKR